MRIYFQNRVRLRGEGFWGKFFAPSLGSHLIKSAKKFGIEQAVHQPIIAGYLKGDPISYDISDVPPPKLPSCVEMIDHENRLRDFLKDHEHELKDARIVLVKSENILLDHHHPPPTKII
jgi:PII-like signaling protein